MRFKISLDKIFGCDLRALALFRIALALLLLAQIADRAASLKIFYSDDGMFPRSLAITFFQPWDWSLYFITGAVGTTALLFTAAALSAALLALGYRTRLFTVLSYLFIVSLQMRNFFIPNGGDYLLRLLTFWSIFLPLGARYSIDSAMGRNNPLSSSTVTTMATAAVLLQGFCLYFFTGLSKLSIDVWTQGTALRDALALEHYARPFAQTLLFIIPDGAYRPLAHSIIAVELGGALLLLSPFFTNVSRYIALLLFLFLQLGFHLCLEVNLFPFAATTALLPFLPTPACDLLFKRLQGIMGPIHSFLSRFSTSGPLLKRTSTFSKGMPRILKMSGNAIIGLFIVFIFLSNIEGLTYRSPFYRSRIPRFLIPEPARWVGNFLKLDQGWDMFMPPGKVIYWYVGLGKLTDGSVVDILRDGAPLQWEKPKVFFKTEPERAYFMNLGGPSKERLLPLAGAYLCQDWNRRHLRDKQITELEIFLMSQESGRAPAHPGRFFSSLLKQPCTPAQT